MKRTSGGLHKRVARISIADHGNTTTDEGRHDETEIDPIKQDWHIFRGPPDYTHTSLPAIYVNNADVRVKMFEAGIRLTSPYQPFFNTASTDLNTDVTGVTTALELSGASPFATQFFGFYSQLYRYYSVISCRYRITAENYGSEPIWMHIMKYNQERPPSAASNEDIYLWRGTQSHYMTPHATFYDTTVTGTGGDRSHTFQYNMDTDNNIDTVVDTAASRTPVSRRNNAVIVVSDQYNAGDSRREVALDSEISTWTPVAQNPSYPENLLIRFNTDEAATGATPDNVDRNRRIQVNLRMEVEYLCEFKELTPEVRYPVRRDPITLTFTSSNQH
nr:MAG: capsid protein [Grus japonensis parvo-like hybrid virus]